MSRTSRALATVVAVAAAFTFAGAAAATATPGSSPQIVSAAPTGVRAVQLVCTVNDNGVNYRGGPGENYPVFGTVNKGQNLDYLGREGNWVKGNLWGGRTGVWIHVSYLNC
ncbi:SH3 domain-containing protein [Streptomyces sp. NPDC088725]|uniref:SH3 domain-containing protein n=1 Tax=Streptomyces sp. NPDC088725 TaxID=3365873 RepID=UPI00383024EC